MKWGTPHFIKRLQLVTSSTIEFSKVFTKGPTSNFAIRGHGREDCQVWGSMLSHDRLGVPPCFCSWKLHIYQIPPAMAITSGIFLRTPKLTQWTFTKINHWILPVPKIFGQANLYKMALKNPRFEIPSFVRRCTAETLAKGNIGKGRTFHDVTRWDLSK